MTTLDPDYVVPGTDLPPVTPLPDDHPAHQDVADSVARVAELFAQGEAYLQAVAEEHQRYVQNGDEAGWDEWCHQMDAWKAAGG